MDFSVQDPICGCHTSKYMEFFFYCFTAFTVQPLKDISGGAALRKKKFKY